MKPPNHFIASRMGAAEYQAMIANRRVRRQHRFTRGQMNGDEKRYARNLDLLLAAGQIRAWAFEPRKFVLAPRTTYTPDFCVEHNDGSIEYVETKGYLRPAASVRFKVARDRWPEYKWTMIRWNRKAWAFVPVRI